LPTETCSPHENAQSVPRGSRADLGGPTMLVLALELETVKTLESGPPVRRSRRARVISTLAFTR